MADALALENQLCFPLYAASRETLRRYTPLLAPLGLTYTQYLVMLVLWERAELSVGELGRRLCLDTGTLSPLLKVMETKGLLVRRRGQDDARVVTVAITEAGAALRAQAQGIPAQMRQCLSLSADEARTLYALLYKVLGR